MKNETRNYGYPPFRGVYPIAAAAVFAALVFVASIISVPVPAAFGMTRIHLGNIFCLLSGLILGPVGGGLAAGVGSGLYDIIVYGEIASAPFTMVFKFLLACVCGLVAYSGNSRGESQKRNLLGAILGSVTYMALYLGKSFLEGLLLGSQLGTVLTTLLTKFVTSGINAGIAVVAALPLSIVLRVALQKSGMGEKLYL